MALIQTDLNNFIEQEIEFTVLKIVFLRPLKKGVTNSLKFFPLSSRCTIYEEQGGSFRFVLFFFSFFLIWSDMNKR